MTRHGAIRRLQHIVLTVILLSFVPTSLRSDQVVELSARAKVQDPAGRLVPGAVVGVCETDAAGVFKKWVIQLKGPGESSDYSFKWKGERDRYYVLQAQVQAGGERKPPTQKSRVITTADPLADLKVFTFDFPVEKKTDSGATAPSPVPTPTPGSSMPDTGITGGRATQVTAAEQSATPQQPASTDDGEKTSPGGSRLWDILWALVAFVAFLASIWASSYYGARNAVAKIFHEVIAGRLVELPNVVDERLRVRLEKAVDAEVGRQVSALEAKVGTRVEKALTAHEHEKLLNDLRTGVADSGHSLRLAVPRPIT